MSKQRTSFRSRVGAAALAGFLAIWSAPSLQAQGPALPAVAQEAAEPAQPQVQRTFLNKGVIQLPIHIDERARAQVKEIQLFVKSQPEAPWQKYAGAAWGQNVFTFNAPADGEYWFAMLTVDHQGRTTPPDISKEGPGLIVIVDRQAPQVDLATLGASAEGQLIQCEARDEFLDPQKTKVHYQTGDRLFRNLDSVPGQPGVYCIPSQAVFTGQLRVVAMDLAGNVTSREVNVSQLVPASAAAPAPAPKTLAAGEPRTLPFVLEPQVETSLPLPVAPGIIDKQLATTERQANKVAAPAAPAPVSPLPEGPMILQDSNPIVAVPQTSRPEVQAAPPAREIVAQQRQLVNNPHVFLEYAIEQSGASGVGKVEVWLTRDQGQTWQRHCEDADKKSPAEIDLPGEGLFGISLVITNGRGFGGSPPRPGEAPQWSIEVDTTRPTVEITSVKAFAEGAGSLQISWRAGDKNLAADGIELYHAPSRQGPWQPIAKGLRNEGAYRWTPPAEVGSQSFLRLCARDQAGNTALTETTQPVLLDDQSRPRAQILGATTNLPTRAATTPQ